MFVKNGSAKIVQAALSLSALTYANAGLIKKATKKFAEIDLDPVNYIYVRNRAVSALEIHGPNQNWDAFEYDELSNKYDTFITKPVSVDHVGTDVIGLILDSEFIRTPDIQEELNIPKMPLKDTIIVLNEKCFKEANYKHILAYAQANKLVKSSDKKLIVEAVARTFSHYAGWVENVWAIEKEAAENHRRGLVNAILKNEVTDTSMGCYVQKSVCSVCQNVATGELPEHEDFCDCIRLYKGSQIPIEGMLVIPFEINRDIDFFEDTLILPSKLGGKAGGEGADRDAKLLEVFANKNKKKAYMAPTPGYRDVPGGNPGYDGNSIYVLVGDMPENVKENKDEFKAEQQQVMEDRDEVDFEDNPYPNGTIVRVKIEDNVLDAVVIETNDENIVVAVENSEDPIEIQENQIEEIIEYPDEMSYTQKLEVEDIPQSEMHPESRAAGKK
jgi:hypothetical protein